MPDTKYDRDTVLFDFIGLDLNRPVDSVKPGKIPYGRNIRAYRAGQVEPREGLTDIAQVVAGQSPVHSCRRLNDPFTWIRVVGAGTHLAYGQSAFTDVDSGYSGDPLALVPYRPKDSPTSFMYVADRSRMRKINTSGGLHTIGFAAPANAPTVALGAPPYVSAGLPGKDIDTLQSNSGWGQGGTAAAPSTQTRINTTITYILYDTGTTGWCCIAPSSMANIGQGCEIIVNAGETTVAQSVFPGSAATTIASIIFDSGSSGLCSIALGTQIEQIACDALIRNITKSENARIIAVVMGPDGNKSIRLSAPSTWAATDQIQVIASFRAYTQNNHAAAEALTRSSLRTVVATGTGTLTKTAALDLSSVTTGVSLHPDDYMHVSMSVSDPTAVTEIKVLLDVDSGTNDFTRNYYWRSFRANDLTPAAANLQSLLATRQQILQRQILDSPSVPELPGGVADYSSPQNTNVTQADNSLVQVDYAISQQLEAGNSQFVELRFRLSDLTRVGTDRSRTLANVAVVRLTAIVTGSVTLDIDSWYVQGGYGADTGDTTDGPYFYRYRVRNPATNVASNFSPAIRCEALPLRQQVIVAPSQYAAPTGTSLTTADFVLDIARFGGQIADWHYVGTIPNDASPSFTDKYDDDIVGGNPILANDNYQPWPIIGVPVSGTSGNVAGSTINDSGATFNVSWAPGTRILINNQPYTIYRVISTSRLELVENAGSQTAVPWRIDEPTILAQPMPCLWQSDNYFFACGDAVNLGRLYYSNPDSETTTSTNYLDITSPSEPLMNGLDYNVRTFVLSTENFIQILRTGDPRQPFRFEKVPNGKGLFSRWFLTREPSPVICFGSKDGIYMTTGGSPMSLTDADLYETFPTEGNPGSTVNGIPHPDITSANYAKLRLAYYDEFLYFDYPTGSSYATFVLAFDLGAATRGEAPGGWLWDTYTPNVVFHYGEEGAGVHALLTGGNNTHLYQYTGNSDAGTAILCEISTQSRDQGDARQNKLYGDVMLDVDTQGVSVTATPYFNNNLSSGTAKTFSTSQRDLVTIPVGSTWNTARNISTYITFSVSTSARPRFYIWEPRWVFEAAPIAAIAWEISPTTFGVANYKHFGLVRIGHVSSVDLSLTITLDGITQSPVTISNSGGIYKQDIFRVPVYKGKLWQVRIASSDNLTDFRLDTRATSFEVKAWGTDGQYNKVRAFGDFSYVEG